MKATSVFGGVQVFNILINIVRSKFVAVLLGPSGMGIVGLLTTTISFISALTNFGLGTSAVKDIAEATSSEDEKRVSVVAKVVQRLVWLTGLVGAIITFVLSTWLSEISFGNEDYSLAFKWISITLLFNQLSSGQNVILRGLRKIKYLAQASMIGSILGLIITIPLYYFLGVEGIVPGIIALSISSLVLTWFYSNKVKIKSTKVGLQDTIWEGKDMMKMGFLISLSGLISLGVAYIVRIFISNTGGVAEVGLYNAGFAIINSYVGMVFTAMATDYYPRLSGVSNDNVQSKIEINQQAEIALLILAPIIMIFLIFIKWFIIILYSAKFIEVNQLILWAVLGIFFKAASWAVSFIFLAKRSNKLYFWSELIFHCYLLIFNIIGYKFLGLEGIGISFLASYIIYLIQVYSIANLKYNFSFTNGFYKIFGIQFVLAVICLFLVKITGSPYNFLIGGLIIIISCYYSYKELNDRLDLKSIINGLRGKFDKKND
jgi:O-antigen/teichoic acid export membrane protein